MEPAGRSAKRPYLPSEERRQVLLDVAAAIVGRDGWNALTMNGLALAAGVSRQLVYDHFDGADDLLLSAMRHLFERSYQATAEALQGETDGPRGAIYAAYQIFLDMPPAGRRALRAISNDFGADRPEVRKTKTRMREQILALWVPYARAQTGLDESAARPIVWMLTTAAWGLADLVEEGTVGKGKAKDLLAHFIERVMVPGAAAPQRAGPRSRPSAGRSRTDRKNDRKKR